MPGQWEFQIGPAGTTEVGDHLWVARYLLYRRRCELFDIEMSSIAAKPMKGDWNGAGMHTNFSTKAMREGYDAIIAACEAMGAEGVPAKHLAGYGIGIEDRLTGDHETQRYDQFSYGRVRPRRIDPHSVAGRAGPEGLHRRSSPQRQRRPVRGRHPADQHDRRRPRRLSIDLISS